MYFGPPWITWSNLEYTQPPIWLPVFIQRDLPGGAVGGGIPIRRSSVEIISGLVCFVCSWWLKTLSFSIAACKEILATLSAVEAFVQAYWISFPLAVGTGLAINLTVLFYLLSTARNWRMHYTTVASASTCLPASLPAAQTSLFKLGLLRGRFWGFSPRRCDMLHWWGGVKFGTNEWCQISPNRCNDHTGVSLATEFVRTIST